MNENDLINKITEDGSMSVVPGKKTPFDVLKNIFKYFLGAFFLYYVLSLLFIIFSSLNNGFNLFSAILFLTTAIVMFSYVFTSVIKIRKKIWFRGPLSNSLIVKKSAFFSLLYITFAFGIYIFLLAFDFFWVFSFEYRKLSFSLIYQQNFSMPWIIGGILGIFFLSVVYQIRNRNKNQIVGLSVPEPQNNTVSLSNILNFDRKKLLKNIILIITFILSIYFGFFLLKTFNLI